MLRKTFCPRRINEFATLQNLKFCIFQTGRIAYGFVRTSALVHGVLGTKEVPDKKVAESSRKQQKAERSGKQNAAESSGK